MQFGTYGKREKLLLLDGYNASNSYHVPGTGLRTFHALSHLTSPRQLWIIILILSRRKTESYREVKVQGYTASAGVEIRMGLFDSTSLPLKSFMLSPQHTWCGESI